MSKQEEESGLQCANHPNTTTYVRCSRCGKPICTRCMFATPVGYRCADCYNPQIAPLYKIDPSRLPAAIAGGLGVALLGGVLIALLPDYVFFIALLMGFLVSDVVGRLSNEKHGPTIQLIAIGCLVGGLVATLLLYTLLHPGAFATAFAVGQSGQHQICTPGQINFTRLTQPDQFNPYGVCGQIDLFHILMYAVAIFMAWIRLR